MDKDHAMNLLQDLHYPWDLHFLPIRMLQALAFVDDPPREIVEERDKLNKAVTKTKMIHSLTDVLMRMSDGCSHVRLVGDPNHENGKLPDGLQSIQFGDNAAKTLAEHEGVYARTVDELLKLEKELAELKINYGLILQYLRKDLRD